MWSRMWQEILEHLCQEIGKHFLLVDQNKTELFKYLGGKVIEEVKIDSQFASQGRKVVVTV